MHHGSQSIQPNEKAPRTRTNALNPPASSVSRSQAASSHGGALPHRRGGPGTLTGYRVRKSSLRHGIALLSMGARQERGARMTAVEEFLKTEWR